MRLLGLSLVWSRQIQCTCRCATYLNYLVLCHVFLCLTWTHTMQLISDSAFNSVLDLCCAQSAFGELVYCYTVDILKPNLLKGWTRKMILPSMHSLVLAHSQQCYISNIINSLLWTINTHLTAITRLLRVIQGLPRYRWMRKMSCNYIHVLKPPKADGESNPTKT